MQIEYTSSFHYETSLKQEFVEFISGCLWKACYWQDIVNMLFAVDAKMSKKQSLTLKNFLLGIIEKSIDIWLVEFSVVLSLILLAFLFGKIANKFWISYLGTCRANTFQLSGFTLSAFSFYLLVIREIQGRMLCLLV